VSIILYRIKKPPGRLNPPGVLSFEASFIS